MSVKMKIHIFQSKKIKIKNRTNAKKLNKETLIDINLLI